MTQYPRTTTDVRALSRRQMLARCGCGIGSIALAAMCAEHAAAVPDGTQRGAADPGSADRGPFTPRPSHVRPPARNVIFLYMDGGPSQVDTFDPKPRLQADHGKPFGAKILPTQFNNNGHTLGSPWKFQRYGQCGLPVSDLFPHVARHADELAVIRSMTSKFSEHTNANYFLHTGHGQQGRPSMGAWVGYGLGSESRDLPGFIVLNGGLIPPGGLDNFNSGFLPATYQGSIFNPGDSPVANVRPTEPTAALQRNKLDLMRRLDAAARHRGSSQHVGDDAIDAAIANYELAFRMQVAVPELLDLKSETAETRREFGLEAKYAPTATFGRQCLLARRLVERGVRFVQLTCPGVGTDRWDQHSGLKDGHEKNALAVDQPIAALLTDLRRRGLLEETLVVWSGEFGRTPFAQGSDGRDHNPFGFTTWLAGGGARGGAVHGATDEFGYHAIENKVEMHDLHATILHLLGIDHKRLTFRFSGRDMRLTDVHGNVILPVVA